MDVAYVCVITEHAMQDLSHEHFCAIRICVA